MLQLKRAKVENDGSGVSNLALSVAAPSGTMRLLSWNVRGLGNPRILYSLRNLVRVKAPDLVFLPETKN